MTIEQEFIVSLAAGHVRHVRTAEGAKFYGLPVGSPITKDIIDAKKAAGLAQGIKPPAGALTKNPAKIGKEPKVSAGGNLSPHAKVPDAPKMAAPKAPKPPKVSKASLKGNQHFMVGKSEYTAPAGSILVKPKGVDNVAFVRTTDGKIHAFTEQGQVEIPKELEQPFSEKFKDGFTGDENFDVVPFDKTSASFGIEQMKPGDNLVDSRGEVVFTKNNDGSWKHATFGINLSEEDIKPMYDSGELTPEKTDTAQAAEQAFSGNENLNFADMNAQELQKTLDGLPEGFNLELGTNSGLATLTKQPDGSWKSDITDGTMESSSLYYVKSQLKVGQSAPDAAKQKLQAAEPNPLDANATGLAPTPPAKGETPTADWIKTAPPGSAFVYHGDSKDTTWENHDGTWFPNGNIDIPGGGYDSNEMADLMATANSADLEITKVGKPPKDVPGAPAEKKIGTLGATPQDKIGKPNAEPPAPTQTFADLADGSKVDPQHIDQMQPGNSVKLKNGFVHTKIGDNTFEVTTPDGKTQPGTGSGHAEALKQTVANTGAVKHPDALAEWEKELLKGNQDIPKEPKPVKPDENILTSDQSLEGQSDLFHHLEELPKGQEIYSEAGTKLTKQSNGKWKSEATGIEISSADLSLFQNYTADPKKVEAKKQAEADHQAKLDALLSHVDNAAPGDTLLQNVDGEETLWTKAEKDNWTYSSAPGDNYLMSADELKKEIDTEGPDKFQIGQSEQKDIQAVMDAPAAPEPFKVGESVPADHFIDNAQIGESFKADNSHFVWTKTGDNQWENGTSTATDDLLKQGNFGDKVTVVDSTEGLKSGASFPAIGDVVNTFDGIKALPPKTQLSYFKKNGEESVYTTLDNGMILSPHGVQYSPEKLSNSVLGGKFTVKSYPDVMNAPKTPEATKKVYAPNDQIEKYGHLRDMPVGTVIKDAGGPNYTGIELTKQDDGSWKVTNKASGELQNHVYSPDELANAVKDKYIYFKSAPDTTDQTQTVEVKDTQVFPGSESYSTDEIKQAIDALEAHTGFQISYGFKSIPDHPFANKETQDKIKVEALQKYPDLKPKAAFVQYLKDKAGVVDATPETEKKNSADGPKILLGSGTPKSTSGGMDGGEFSQHDIAEAINILENYDGKIFKNELNKKGNPLGVLNPVTIVGFDKDKLVTKQKFIDLLKQKLDNADTPDVKTSKVSDMEEFKSYPIGTKVSFTPDNPNGNTKYYTKSTKSMWTNEQGGSLDENSFEGTIKSGKLNLESTPKATPDYAHVPEAIQAVSDEPAVENVNSYIDAKDYAVGSILTTPQGDLYYTKIDENTWTAVDAQSGFVYTSVSNEKMSKWLNDATVIEHKVDGPNFNESGVGPGKYSSGGKAHMFVTADGSGVYVNGTGTVQALTAEKVKKNYESGMNLYLGLPDNIPSVPAPAPKKKSAKVEDIADGKYFGGSPTSPKTIVYEVKGNDVQMWKPKASTEGVNAKIGQKTTPDWLEKASVGAQFKYVSYYQKSVDKAGNLPAENFYTKQADGKWVNGLGNEAEDWIMAEAKNSWNTDVKVASHGTGDPVKITKAKLNTLFAKGELTDVNGNSVVPDGHSGAMYFFGSQTDIPSLLKLKKKVDAATVDDLADINAMAKELGVFPNSSITTPYLKKHYANSEGAIDNVGRLQFWKDSLADAVDGVDTTIPKSDATKYFTFDTTGHPHYPAELATMSGLYSISDYNNFIKTASAKIGDGKIIGLHANKMTKYEKSDWIAAFKSGDFKKMYALEVAAAAKDNKAHGSGFLHPGYEGNEETNKMQWGAAVEGEIPAGTDIEGDWSAISIEPSMEEVNNYLIKAQMQNPTYLSNSEKRAWYKWHRNGQNYKAQVDQLSVTAKTRKANGESPVTEPLTWTDNVQPAKTYTKFFDDEKFPVTAWTTYAGGQASVDYMNDHPEIKEIKEAYDKIYKEQYGSPVMPDNAYAAKQAVSGYFTDLAQKEYEKSLIPVYTLKPNQTVKKSTHPVFQYTDQWGNEYFFKPRPNTKLDKYRSEVEHLGNQFGKLFGFQTADSKLVTIDGKYGQLQKDVGGVSDLMGADYSKLTDVQIADIGSEHLLDAFLDNDDTKGDNAKILPSGRIVGIDKGRAFKHYGAWKAFAADSSMNSNAQTIYSQLYDAIRAKKIDKETLDKAYLAIQKKAEKMAKVSDEKISEMLKEGMVNRDQFDNSYTINGKKVPNTEAGLISAVLDRKNKLPELTKSMWEKIYKDAGYDALPEKPKSPLGDVISGMDHDQLHEEVFKAQATGKTTMIAGSHVIGGSALMWTDKYADGSTNLNGEMFLAPKKQKEVLDYLVQNATDMSHVKASEVDFSDFDTYGSKVIDAAKTINHHAVDKAYNQAKIDSFNQAAKDIETELNEWAPDLTSNAKFNGAEAYKFSTGNVVPMQHIDQYKLMLDKYSNDVAVVQKAKETEGKTGGIIAAYQALKLSPQNEKWVSPEGNASFTKLNNGKWLKTYRHGQVEVGDMSPEDIAKMEGNGWVKQASEKATENSGVKIVKMAKTHEKNAKIDGHTKTITGTTGGINGSSGQEYEITLPTGEKIYFRNADNTNTKRGQHGKLMFRVDGVEDSTATKAAMERIQAQLEAMGISTEAADHEHAELHYWHEMYGILENRKHEAGSKYEKAKKKLDAKVKEIGGDPNEFLENLGEKLPPQAENEFWRDLYSEFWPDKVQKLINEEGYLPKFDHQNLENPELETGKPYWERFDIDLEELYKQNKMLMSATGGEPNPMIVTGGALSAEERLRQADQFSAVGSWSASSDQAYGSSHNIYTRVKSISEAKGFNAFYDPRMLLRTRTYSFNSDNFGNLANRKTGSPSDPLHVLKKFNGGSNETMLPHAATLLDGIEIYAFDYAEKRNEAIQHLKKMGIEMIRGLPIEDRLVMREKVNEAIQKVKDTWLKKL